MEELRIILMSIYVYVVFTAFFSLFLIFGERYVRRHPKCKFGLFWRKHVVKK